MSLQHTKMDNRTSVETVVNDNIVIGDDDWWMSHWEWFGSNLEC